MKALIILSILLFLATFLSLFLGSVKVHLKEAFSPPSSLILWKVRAPRVVLAASVGAALSVCGCVMQAIFQNPLASPYTLGLSGGAAFGASIATLFGLAYTLPFFSFLGAAFSIFLVFLIAARTHFLPHSLLLSGVMINIFFSSLVLFIFALLESERVHEVLLWLCGDLGGASINKSLLFLLALSILALFLFLKELDILTLGDERAKSLGINPSVCRRKLFLLCSFATALCVCFVGVIGFVGLIIPALLRRILGSVHSRLLPSCALSGATFLLLSDTFSRTAFSPFELPVGVVTGVCGGAFFLSLLSVKKDA